MKNLFLFITFIFFFGCDNNASPGHASTQKNNSVTPTQPQGNIFEYGIYSAQRKGRIRNSLSSNTGKIVTKPVLKLSQQTHRIPLIKNTFFAYRYRLINLPKDEVKKPTVELRKVLIHPQMTLPDGSISTGWDRTFKGRTSISQVIAFDGYVFNEDYELVEGDWIFQIWFRDMKLTEQVFTTYKTDQHSIDLTDTSTTNKIR